jgi:hypothetical protein
MYECNPALGRLGQAGGSEFFQPGLHSETLSQKRKKEKEKKRDGKDGAAVVKVLSQTTNQEALLLWLHLLTSLLNQILIIGLCLDSPPELDWTGILTIFQRKN